MNLKFRGATLDERGLMYVEFSHGGKLVRWYPRWKDVYELLSHAMFTESALNRGKHRPYLSFMCLEALAREHLHPVGDMSLVQEFNDVTDKIRDSLLSVTNKP